MKVFLSWSGNQSHFIAQSLHDWLPLVLQYLRPWLSSSNIDVGSRWDDEVAKELDSTDFGILCLTPSALSAPWLLFEAGALAKKLHIARVVPVLYDLEISEVEPPLARFQACKLNQAGILQVLDSINKQHENPITTTKIATLAEALWPKLHQQLRDAPSDSTLAESPRPQPEVLEELVTLVRDLHRNSGSNSLSRFAPLPETAETHTAHVMYSLIHNRVLSVKALAFLQHQLVAECFSLTPVENAIARRHPQSESLEALATAIKTLRANVRKTTDLETSRTAEFSSFDPQEPIDPLSSRAITNDTPDQ